MKIRRLACLFIHAALLGCTAAFAQTVDISKLKFNGVGLDSTFAQVVKAIGKPVKDGRPTREECIGGREKEVEYAGVKFFFMDGDSGNKKTFEVKSFTVTSPKWVVSGVKVGDSEADVRRVYGRKYMAEDDSESGGKRWSFEFDDEGSPGFTTVIFKDGKVVEISSSYMVC